MKYASTLVVSMLVAGCRGAGDGQSSWSIEVGANAPGIPHPTVPTELDGKGLLALDERLAERLQVRLVTASDWLCGEGGELLDRNRSATVEYDSRGRWVRFSGQVDQGGHEEAQVVYSGDFVSEERHFSGEGEEREAMGRIVHLRPESGTEEVTVYDDQDNAVGKLRILKDEAGRRSRILQLDLDSGEVVSEMAYRYDALGNLVETSQPEGLATYSFDGSVLTVSRYTGPQAVERDLHSTIQYTFDDLGRLKRYHRMSGDGSYWDRFDYKLDERGLPIEKVWSRHEMMLQDPYEVTKYTYQHFE